MTKISYSGYRSPPGLAAREGFFGAGWRVHVGDEDRGGEALVPLDIAYVADKLTGDVSMLSDQQVTPYWNSLRTESGKRHYAAASGEP